MRTTSFLAKAMSVLAMVSIAGVANADGIASTSAAAVYSPTAMLDTRFPLMNGVVVSKTVDVQEIVAMAVRRNHRLAARKNAIAIAAQPVVVLQPTVQNIDRVSLVQRGLARMPSACAALHTHDRAVCLTQVQTSRMVRTQQLAAR